ncbi:MAG: type 1 periplasmic-binding domain-containing protein, partial [Planctomycetota bacterium]
MAAKKSQPFKQIALAMPMRMPHLERAIYGVMRYARQHTRWTFLTSPELPALSVTQLKGWPGDGVIAMVNTQAEIRAAKALKLPVVNLSGALKETPFPRVRVDYQAAGRAAADHLLGRGFQRFAYYGLKDVWYADETGRGFIDRITEFGGRCKRHDA